MPRAALCAQPLPPGEWLRILRRRECWTLVLARFFTDPVIYFIIFWLPEYLRKERHYDLASIGKYAWVPRARKLVLIGGAAVMPDIRNDAACSAGCSSILRFRIY